MERAWKSFPVKFYGEHQMLCNRVSVICDNSYPATTFDFRFARLDLTEQFSGADRMQMLSVSRMGSVGCACLTSPPLARDVLGSVWVQ